MGKTKKKINKLLCLTLILALLVSGLTYPGFLLPLFRQKIKVEIPPESTYVHEVQPVTGNSQAFSITPCEGFTLSAEANALDKDRTWNVERVSYDTILEQQEKMHSIDGYNVYVFDAWEIDAGLADDELLPGEYKMVFNLRELGIPEDLWEGVSFIRIDDSGKIYEYCSKLDGETITVYSKQNSLIECVILFGLLFGPSSDAITAVSAGVSFSPGSSVIPVKDESGTHVYNLKVTRDETVLKICEQLKVLESPIRMEASQKAVAEMKRLHGPDWRQNGYEKELEIAELEYAKILAKKNDEYMQLNNTLQEYLKGYIEGEELEAITRAKQFMLMARHYLADILKVQIPTYVMDVELSNNMKEGGVTVSPFIGHPYCVFNVKKVIEIDNGYNMQSAYDEFLLTIVHEFMHASQRTYKWSSYASFKLDEMIAQLVEEDAYHYFTDTYDGEYKITTKEGHLKNLKALQFYALPLDGFSSTFADGKSLSLSGDKQADASYPFASFLRYVWNKHKPAMKYAELMKKYEGFDNPDISEFMKETFGISEEELTQDYVDYMKINQLYFYDKAAALGVSASYYSPALFTSTQKENHVPLNNGSYTTRVRHIYPYTQCESADLVRILVVQDSNFAEALPDVHLLPVGATKAVNCKYGTITNMVKVEDMDFWIMEIDGGTSKAGWFSDNSGYTAYTLTAPTVEAGVVEDGLFKFTLPEKSIAAQAGYIDGYRVTIKSSDDVQTVRYYKIDGAGEEIGIKVGKLTHVDPKKNPEDEGEGVSFTLSVCEYIREPNGKRIYGPDSDDARSMEQTMDDMLEQMGALTGKITISMGWSTYDDLDLHCTTPSGAEIAYYNKNAEGGHLDVDMNADSDNLSTSPVENIYFEDPEPGEYHIWIDNYRDRTEDGDSTALVRVTIGSEQFIYRLTLGGSAEVMRFTYGSDESVEIGGEYLDTP